MSDTDILIDLQMRMMEQENTIERLHNELVAQQKSIGEMQLQFKSLQQRLDEAQSDSGIEPGGVEPPPPHY